MTYCGVDVFLYLVTGYHIPSSQMTRLDPLCSGTTSRVVVESTEPSTCKPKALSPGENLGGKSVEPTPPVGCIAR